MIFEASGLGYIKDPKLLVIFVDDFRSDIIDVSGLAEPFRFGTRSDTSDPAVHKELARLGLAVADRAAAYTLVLLIGPTGQIEWSQDTWMNSLKSLVKAEPQGSLLRALHITLRGCVPKAKLRVYNTCIHHSSGQPIIPQLKQNSN